MIFRSPLATFGASAPAVERYSSVYLPSWMTVM